MKRLFFAACVAVFVACGCSRTSLDDLIPGGSGGGYHGRGGAGGATTTRTNEGGAHSGGSGNAVCKPVYDCDPSATEAIGKAKCDDGDEGTADRCADVSGCGGLCVHVPVQCDHYDSIEVQQTRCDDGNECTADRCNARNFCLNQPIANMPTCADGEGVCFKGECYAGVCDGPGDCPDEVNPCWVGACDVTGHCLVAPGCL